MEASIELVRRKERLIARADAQRREIAGAFQELQRPMARVDRVLAGARFLRSHPALVAAFVAALVLLRRRRIAGLLARGLAAWRTWRAVAPWLQRAGWAWLRNRARGER